jgi:hypothetical protein
MNRNKKFIYLKKNIKLSDNEKNEALEKCRSTKNIDMFEDFAELYHTYFEDVERDKNSMRCYHEFSIDNTSIICLFLDIDISANSLKKPIETLVNIYNKTNKIDTSASESISSSGENTFSDLSDDDSINSYGYNYGHRSRGGNDVSDLYLLKKLIEKLCRYIYKHSKDGKYAVKQVLDDEYVEINDVSYKNFLESCYRNLAISKNVNMVEKYSYHVYFNNIIFNHKDIAVIKTLIKNFVAQENNPFAEGIDTQVYKKKISLRTIYSKKNNDDDINDNYHYPIYVDYRKNNLIIEQEIIDIEEETLPNYFCTINDIYNRDNYVFIHKCKAEETSDEETEVVNTIQIPQNSPNISFLTLKDILTLIFKKKTLVSFQTTNFLENIDTLNTNILYIDYINKYKELTLDFNYNAGGCLFCKKSSHKNKHYISTGTFGINIIKKGNMKSCKIQSVPYKTMTELKICEYIYKQGVIKKTLEGEIIYFTETEGWKHLENNMFSGIKSLMKRYYENFRSEEIDVIDNMTDKKIKECFMTLTHSDEKVNTIYPYLFKFKNGILDLKTSEFLPMKNTKHLYIVVGVNYDYIEFEKYDETQMKKYKFLEEVIDQIMPEINDNGEYNSNRRVFECNVSSSLAKDFKDVITVFEGPTLAGKSTVKQLICSSLGDKDNYIDIPISVYAQPINPKVPDPWLGQIEGKCVSFASEPGFERTINTQTIKLLTEPRILSRKLYSNDIGQLNYLSQFIDTNYNLKLDVEDPAAYRRWAVIKFKSHFQNKDSGNLLLNNIDVSNKYTQIKSLKSDIIKNLYSLDFFHMLHKWFKKYHLKGLKMENTASESAFYIVNECINNMSVPGCIITEKNIKPDRVTNYGKAKYRVNYNKMKVTVGTSKKYFVNYFQKFLKYKNIDYNLNKLVSELVIILKTTAVVPLVLIDDIKEEDLPEIVEKYKILTSTKNNTGTDFDLTYYYKNREIFETKPEDDEEDRLADFFLDEKT